MGKSMKKESRINRSILPNKIQLFILEHSESNTINFSKIKLPSYLKGSKNKGEKFSSNFEFIKILPKITLPKYSITTLFNQEGEKELFGETSSNKEG